jgi:hypothetical protein
MFGPTELGIRAVNSGWATWRNRPEEWGDRWEGFGKRFASGTGKSIIKSTTQYALEEAFKLDGRYYRSTNRSAKARIKNAVISPFIARDRYGARVIGYPRIIGKYTAAMIAAETWYPDRFTWKDGLKSGTLSLGLSAGYNLVKEFIWKK